jgi:hypothetical protein
MSQPTKTYVQHWRHHDISDHSELNGWTCWVYTRDPEFLHWMKENCPGADVAFRFNSGDPMYTVHITDESEATVFTLRWSS